ncbi:hypothetical protein MWU78_15935 [Arenibacter sp. F26102]|uniref:hypothetical protein n=1 Tax=Arenibacter sp. F26102 TaxID=2926416 RepID=UPI001FF60B9F|nr:hypothetical protein [Arenibacter sp. F26102]MCK0147148.1 hypothetical protein [Arenibacter sp. F26102]
MATHPILAGNRTFNGIEKITDIFKLGHLANAVVLEANTFATGYLENLSDNNFKIPSFPASDQFAPIHNIHTEYLNSDPNLDAILVDIFYGTPFKNSRYDSNKRTLLIGEEKGIPNALNQKKSGIDLNVEARDIKAIPLAYKETLRIYSSNNQVPNTFKTNF